MSANPPYAAVTAASRPRRSTYDPKEPRGKSGVHGCPLALPVLQNTGSVLFGIVLWNETSASMFPYPQRVLRNELPPDLQHHVLGIRPVAVVREDPGLRLMLSFRSRPESRILVADSRIGIVR